MKVPEFIGIDIGSDSIKICHLKKKRTAYELLHVFRESSVNELLRSEGAENQKRVASLIKDVLKKAGIDIRNCVISVPEDKVYSRLLNLPEIKGQDLDEAITWALKPLIPVAIEQVNISSIKVGETQSAGKKLNSWYVVAAPKTLIESKRRLFQQAGMNLLAIETEALAITRAVAANHDFEHDVLIVDVGAEATNIILARKQGVIFSQAIETASNSFSRALSTDFGINMSQADELKVGIGLKAKEGDERSTKVVSSMMPIVDLILTEIRRTITYYKEKLDGKELQRVYLTGGGSLLPGMGEYISSELGMEALEVNLLEKFEKNQVANNIGQYNVQLFNVAIGLALKGYLDF